MKSESNESSSPSRPPTEPSTPDTASVAESTTANHSVEGTNENTTSTLTVRSSPSSSNGDSTKKGKGKDKEEEKKGGNEPNLVGKITNLVSTDLKNIVDGRDFPVLFISLPLQVIFCIVFLYKVLGWSAIVGMVAMVTLYPLPGWVASKMQSVQREKMKIVSDILPFTSCDCLITGSFFYRRTRVFRS